MDDIDDMDTYRAARRREQNRVAQQNHRKRKQLMHQSNRQQPPCSRQATQQPWQRGRSSCEGGDGAASSISPERQAWEQDLAIASPWRPTHGESEQRMDPLQQGYFDVFDTLIEAPDQSSLQTSITDTSLSSQGELAQDVGKGINGDSGLPSAQMNPQRQEPTLDMGPRKRRLPSSNMSSDASQHLHLTQGSRTAASSGSYAQSYRTELSSPPSLRSLQRSSARTSGLQKSLSPVFMTTADAEQDRPSRGGQAQAFGFRSQPLRRRHEPEISYSDQANADSHGQTCLHLAAAKGSSGVVRYLLEGGISLDATDSQGFTALHYASGGGHEDIVSILLRKGADVEMTDNGGRTALHFAIEKGQNNVVVLLIKEGADVNATVCRPVRRFSN